MPIVPPTSTLQAIQNKVRRLTRSPSASQITDSDLQNYINTFVVYDFPEHLRTFNLRTQFTFYTNPYQDEYATDTASFGTNPLAQNNVLYNFQNKYLTVHPPAYVGGYQTLWTQSRDEFFAIYPKINFIQFTGNAGDGVTTSFTGVINSQQSILPNNNFNQNIGLLQRQVLFDSADASRNGISLVDVPLINPTTGNLTTIGNLYDPNSAAYQAALVAPPTVVDPTNTINYATGIYTITFGTAPGANIPINSQTVPNNLAIPQAILYYNNKFVVRPVPDQVYRVNFECYVRPTALLAANQSPELEEYWQYIAFSAAKKILEDRMDMESVALLMPALREQQNLCNRRTLVQYTNERTATIYTDTTGTNSTGWGNSGGLF